MTPDPEKVREIAYPGQSGSFWRDLGEGDLWVHGADGRMWPITETVDPGSPFEIDANFGPMEPAEVPILRPDEQPQDERDGAVKLARRPPCERISYIADQLEASITDLRGLPGVSRARVVLAASVASLRELADEVLELEVEQPERDADVRAVAAVLKAYDGRYVPDAMLALGARFTDRIAQLDAREGGETP